jgi:hypothetical protein
VPLWKLTAEARRRLAARRLIDSRGQTWDRWKLARMVAGGRQVEVAIGTHLRVLWQAPNSFSAR